MKYCTREELLHRNTPVRTHDLLLPSGRCLKVVPLLPEIRARFPKLDPWKKLVAALHFGIVKPKLSVNDVVAFLNTAPMEAVAAGKLLCGGKCYRLRRLQPNPHRRLFGGGADIFNDLISVHA